MILTGYLEPDPKILAHWLAEPATAPRRRMSAEGASWHSMTHQLLLPELSGGAIEAALTMIDAVTGEPASPRRLEWWANVLQTGAAYRLHHHSGTWAFVHHLTDGAALRFPKENKVFPAKSGQLLVFPSTSRHCTDAVTEPHRVSIAGNIWY